jgi:quercetin dioxygenase-like cupin family protein
MKDRSQHRKADEKMVRMVVCAMSLILSLPLHKHPVINAGVVLRGRLTVVTEDGATLHLSAGEAAVEVVDRWHYGWNEGDEPVEIVVFYAGVRDRPVAITKPIEE